MPTSTEAGCPPSRGGPDQATRAGVLTTLPSRGPPPLPPGPKSLFSEPGGLPGLLALTVPEPLGGWWGGTVARPASPASHPMLLSPVGISGAV